MKAFSDNDTARVRRVRRAAARENLRVRKFREGNSWYWQYGPFALMDENNYLTATSMGLDDLEAAFNLATVSGE